MSARQELAAAFRAALQARTRWASVAKLPKDGTITVVSRADKQSRVGIFRDGEWRGEKGKVLPWEPTHWLGFTDGPA